MRAYQIGDLQAVPPSQGESVLRLDGPCTAGRQKEGMLNATEILKLLEILAWPVVAVVAIVVVRPQIARLLSGAQVKLSIAGQSIETTLPELKQVLEEQAGEPLGAEHVAYLLELQRGGTKYYSDGVKSSEERKFLRPLRNNGLVLTVPRNVFLGNANGIELSALGRLYLRAKAGGAEK